MFECFNAFKDCLTKGMNTLYEKNNYRLFFWLNSYCGWAQLEPIVHEAIVVLVKKGDKDIKDRWCKKMKHMPTMRIKVVPTAIASSSFGPGIAAFDNIQIGYYNGVDLHDYDKKVDDWKKRVFDPKTHGIRPDCDSYNLDVKPGFGKELSRFEYNGDDIYEKEESLYNGICDGTAFRKLIDMNECEGLNKILEEKPL